MKFDADFTVVSYSVAMLLALFVGFCCKLAIDAARSFGTFSAHEPYFSLIPNQPTELSIMAYQPNKPERTVLSVLTYQPTVLSVRLMVQLS